MLQEYCTNSTAATKPSTKQVHYCFNLCRNRFDYVSEAAQFLLGYDSEEMLECGVDWLVSRYHPADARRLNEEYDRRNQECDYLDGIEYRFLHADGSYVKVSESRQAIYTTDNVPTHLLGCVRVAQ